MTNNFFIVLAVSIFPFNLVYAKKIIFKSSAHQTQVIELFTSESCSSCPPAEEKLNSLVNSPYLWKQIIPVEFHVSYWNHLNWVDPYSQKRFSTRQRNYRKFANTSSVYTPQFLQNGLEWKAWRLSHFPLINKTNTPGILKLSFNYKSKSGRLQFNTTSNHLLAHVVLMGNGKSNVHAGENKGKILIHHFAVREHYSSKLTRQGFPFKLPKDYNQNSLKLSLAGWIENTKTHQIIQGVGGFL